MKRIFDVLLSFAGLLAVLPILAVAIVAIRMETPGRAIFAQTRVGRGERPFTCYKLRTMHTDTKSLPTHEVGTASVTRLGARLRKWKLDELPQLYNVLMGQMSFVGPRPCLPSQTRLIELRRQHGVFDLRPGITGLAQVNGIDMSQPELLASVDGKYAQSMGFFEDLRLIAATVLGKGLGVDHVAKDRRPDAL